MNETYYFLPNQTLMAKVDTEKSRVLAEQIQAERGKCHQNSFRAMELMKDSKYVEGYAIFVSPKFCNLWKHVWLELDGVIIDPYPNYGKTYRVFYIPSALYNHDEIKAIWQDKIIQRKNWHLMVAAIRLYHTLIKPKDSPIWWGGGWLITAVKMLWIGLWK